MDRQEVAMMELDTERDGDGMALPPGKQHTLLSLPLEGTRMVCQLYRTAPTSNKIGSHTDGTIETINAGDVSWPVVYNGRPDFHISMPCIVARSTAGTV